MKEITRREAIEVVAKTTAATYFALNFTGCGSSSGGSSSSSSSSSTTFVTPPSVAPDSSNNIGITAVEGSTEFYSGTSSSTMGFVDTNNSAGTNYLGPTIRITATNPNGTTTGTPMVDQGTKKDSANDVNFTITNNTSTSISTHWHGLHVDGYIDGGPYNAISSGGTWNLTMPVYQQASFNWYHTHIHGETAEGVYKGLAGLFIIEDANSLELANQGLPNTYGTDDFPLIIQDKTFSNSAMDSTNVGGRFAGDTMMVNGVVSPNLEVEAGLIRFRIINASNARFYDFDFVNTSTSTTATTTVIATEGGLLGAPVQLSSTLRMSPGERNEVVVDFSAFNVGDVISLRSVDNESSGLDNPFSIMTFTVVAQTSATSGNAIPSTLNADLDSDRTTLLAKTPDAYVKIDLKGGANPFASARSTSSTPTATDVSFNMGTANFTSTCTQTSANYTEEWTVTGNRHPFHLHGCHAMIKSINGSTTFDDHLKGWKDTFELYNESGGSGEVVFMVQFNEYARAAGTSHSDPGNGSNYMYMMHCHILGHEDNGMMGVFEVS